MIYLIYYAKFNGCVSLHLFVQFSETFCSEFFLLEHSRNNKRIEKCSFSNLNPRRSASPKGLFRVPAV